jgi:uncharacterized membrane protein YvlD (DUF360 family)
MLVMSALIRRTLVKKIEMEMALVTSVIYVLLTLIIRPISMMMGSEMPVITVC